jgi:zinc transporter ZupT
MDTATDSKMTFSRATWWAWAVLPLLLLGAAIWLFIQFNPMQSLTGGQPPVEELSIQRVELRPEGMIVHVVNGGPEPVTIAQVLVDEAYWSFSIEPGRTLSRLERATVQIPYHWVQGEAHEIRLITSTGVTFDYTVDVAVETPRSTLSRWLLFALIGAFVGIIPVGLGLMWFPLLRQLRNQAMNFILALTVGLLVFLLVDTALEGIEIAEQVPDIFQAVPLVFFAGLLSFLVLMAAGRRSDVRDGSTPQGRRWIATAIAIGIGLHNLGEGMAIGAAIATGEAALGSFLVIGFTLHNITEGVGIGAPMAEDRPGVARLAGLTLLAGAPAIFGTWMGGFSYSPLLAVTFLAIGAGAILQVIVEVGRLLLSDAEGTVPALSSWVNIGGVTTGLAVMYLTALLV